MGKAGRVVTADDLSMYLGHFFGHCWPTYLRLRTHTYIDEVTNHH